MNDRMAHLTRPNTSLQGRWLWLARCAWSAIVLLALFLYIVNLSIGWADMQRICPTPACVPSHLDPLTLHQIQQMGISPRFFLFYFSATDIITVILYLAVAVFMFWRRSNDGMAILISLMLVTFGIVTASGSFDSAASSYPALRFPSIILTSVSNLCFTLFFYLFPNGHFVPRWTRIIMVVAIPLIGLSSIIPGYQANPLAFIPIAASYLFAQAYRYRYVSNIEQRQQTKWVVFGVAAAILGLIILSVFINPQPVNSSGNSQVSLPVAILSNTAFHLVTLFIPVSLAIAILRHRLFDIDVIIRRTLVYGVLSACLALVYFGSVLLLQQVFRSLTGDISPIAIVISTLAIAALFGPLRKRVQDFIDRRFYRRKYDAEKALADFAAAARAETDLDTLTGQLTNVVSETIQPERLSLWLKDRHQ